MSTVTIYSFDMKNGEYKSERPAQTRPNGQPILNVIGGTHIAPPAEKEGFARVWQGTGWAYIEDHRQKRDKGGVIIEGSGTAYWLNGDTYQTPARYLTELGPLPSGCLMEKPAKPADVVAAEELEAAKSERASAVSKITVEVDGMIFDGDETSQDRMSRAISAALALGMPMDATTEWTLADNTAGYPTVTQMAQALYKAGQAQTAVWRDPYTTDNTEA